MPQRKRATPAGELPKPSPLPRRGFLKALGGAAVGALATGPLRAEQMGSGEAYPLACNQYPWVTQYRREGRQFEDDLAYSLAQVRDCGAESLEPILESEAMLERLIPPLREAGLRMVSIYVNSELHEQERAEASIQSVLRLATRSQEELGTQIVVTNPSPIRWHGDEDKDDRQLRVQFEALERLAQALKGEGLTLAYHSHDAEMRAGAREFHHMLARTDPASVKLCLDAHWVFRGCGNSQAALFDVVELYGKRIVELHARQSLEGVWTEFFGPGDIDYERLVEVFVEQGVRPLITVEQEVEEQTPRTLTPLEAQIRSHTYAREVFAPFLQMASGGG